MYGVTPILLATLLLAAPAAHQSGPVPPSAMSSIRGTVVGPDGAPVRDVALVLFPASEAAWATAAPSRFQCLRLADGPFTFSTAPPGEYLLAMAPGAIVSDCANPESLRRAKAGAVPITIAPTGAEAVLRLVVASNPVPRIVNMMMSVFSKEVIGPSEPGAVMPPGAPRPPARPPPGRGRPPAIERPGAISGRLTDPDGRPVAGVPVQAARRPSTNPNTMLLPFSLAVTGGDGAYYIPNVPDGEIVVVAVPVRQGSSPLDASAPAVPAAIGEDGRRRGPLLTYFPVSSAAAARPLTVSSGEVSGVDFVMRRGVLAPVSIVVSGLNPAFLPGATATLLPQPLVDQIGGRNVRRAAIMADGRVTLADVPSGTYVLTLNGPSGWARETVHVGVDGRPVDVAVTVRQHFSVSGRVELKAERVRVDPAVLGQIQVELQPVPRTSGSPLLRVPVSETGTFTIPRVPADRYTLTVAPPTFWTPISATINGRDTLDLPVDLSESVADAVLVLADRETLVRGIVRGPDGSAGTGARVVIFADDPQYWTPDTSRRVRVLSAGPGGAYSVVGLPPGSYRAAALAAGTPVTNARLTTIRSAAASFTLPIGGIIVVDIMLEPR